MWIFQQKLKKLGKNLSQWSKKAIGDVHQKMEEWVAEMQIMEEEDHNQNTDYVIWMTIQESLFRQKS